MTDSLRIVHAVCPHDCPDTCAMKVTVQNGRAIKVEGDPTHPTTRGFLCGKVGQHYLEMIYGPNRVLTPRRRIGTKGEGKFVEITWDEAIGDIVARLKAIIAGYGPEAILPYSYSGTLGLLNEQGMPERFFNRLGASLLERTICSEAGSQGYKYTIGASIGTDPEAFAYARLIIVWGSNPAVSGVHLMPFIKEARRKGATLVVIDPRRTHTARLADVFVQPLPGSDAALALGMMHVIINGSGEHCQDLYDHEYVEKHTHGFEQLRQRVQEYPLDRVAAITGVPAEQIAQLARDYATTRPAVIRINYGIQRHTNGGMVVRTIACLPALVGAWRDVGGGILLSTSGAFPLNFAALKRQDLWPDGRPRTINMNRLGQELLSRDNPPIKALFVYDANPAASTPNSAKVLAGLRREDLFTVVHDPYFTDTTDYADIVLPATTQLEHPDIHKAYGNYYLQINQPAIAPLGQSVSNVELFRRLAKAMGFADVCFDDTVEDMIDQLLDVDHPYLEGITRERLIRNGWSRLNLHNTAQTPGVSETPGVWRRAQPWAPFADGIFPTPSGKVEFYSEQMASIALPRSAIDDGYDPLPAHVPLAESAEGSPDLHRKYPLALITPSAHFFLNSSFSHVAGLIRKEKQPFIELSEEDAAARGISDGDLVRVWNDRGECFLNARVGNAVRPGVAASPSVWSSRLMPCSQGINTLTSDRLTDMGRGATFYTNLVEVELWAG